MESINTKGFRLCGYLSQINQSSEVGALVYNQQVGTRKAYPDIFAPPEVSLNTAVLVIKFPPQTPGLILVRNKVHLLPLLILGSGENASSFSAQRLGFPYTDGTTLFANGDLGLDFLFCLNNVVHNDNPDVMAVMPQGPYSAGFAMCVPDLIGATYPEVAIYAPDTLAIVPARMGNWGPLGQPWVKGPFSGVYQHPYFDELTFDQTTNARGGAMAALESMLSDGDTISWAVIANSNLNIKAATAIEPPPSMASRRVVTIDDLAAASPVIATPALTGIYTWPAG